MGQRHVHPPVLVKVEYGDPDRRRQIVVGKQRRGDELSVARIGVERRCFAGPGHQQIDGAIVVQIGELTGDRVTVAAKTRLLRPVGEGPVPIVPPKDVWAASAGRAAGHKQVEVSIMVVVYKSDACRMVCRLNTRARRDVLEPASAEVAIQQHAVAHGQRQIRQAVVVKVARRARHTVAAHGQAALGCRDKLEPAVGRAAINTRTGGAMSHHNQRGPAAAV